MVTSSPLATISSRCTSPLRSGTPAISARRATLSMAARESAISSAACPSRGRRSTMTSPAFSVSPRAMARLGTTTSTVSTIWPEMRSGLSRIAALPGTASRAWMRRARAS